MTPQSVTNAFKIAIDVIRTKIITQSDANRHQLTLHEQIKLHADRDILSWLPESVVGSRKKTKRLHMLKTIPASNDLTYALIKKTKPHIRFVTTWDLGINNCFDTILKHCCLQNNNNIIDMDNMNIVELVTYLDKTIGWNKLGGWFADYNIRAVPPSQFKNTNYENRVIKIKYLEHCNIWKPIWSRQCRGIILFKRLDDTIVCIKSLLQRGAEVLTNMHIEAGIKETQDCNSKSSILSYLDTKQIDTIEKLSNKEPIDGYLSFKNDGSLLGITLINIRDVNNKELIETIDLHGDLFAKTIKKIAISMNLDFIPIISSQDTLFICEDMQPYTLTAIACGFLELNYTDMQELVKQKTISDIIHAILEPFLASINAFYKECTVEQTSDLMSLCFETICENRTSAWGDIHTELAIAYDTSMIRFLGCTFNISKNGGIYKPHFQLESNIKNAQWEQPFWWKINNSSQIENMLLDIDNILNNKITQCEYLEKYIPNNYTPPVNNCFDYEGFVFYRDFNIENMALDYSKIKTKIYYLAHKFRPSNVDTLLKMSDNVDKIFPLIRTVKIFFNMLDSKLATIMNKVADELLNNKTLFDNMISKAQISYDKQTIDTQCRMLINVSTEWNGVCHNAFKSVFSNLNNENKDNPIFKKLVMKIQPWDTENLKLRISTMCNINKLDNLIRELFLELLNKN